MRRRIRSVPTTVDHQIPSMLLFLWEREVAWKIFRWKSIVSWWFHPWFRSIFGESITVSTVFVAFTQYFIVSLMFHRNCKYLMPIKRNWEFQIIIDCLRVCVRALCYIVLRMMRVFWKMYFHLQLLENKREEFVLGNKISKFMSNRWSIWFYTILHPIYIVKIRNLIFQSEHTKLSEGEELEAEAVWSEEWLARSNKL